MICFPEAQALTQDSSQDSDFVGNTVDIIIAVVVVVTIIIIIITVRYMSNLR